MIKFGESRRRMDWIRVDTRKNQGSLIADRRKPGVNGGDTLRCDRDQAGLIQDALLDVPEVESPIADDRSPKSCAELPLRNGQLSLGDRIPRIQPLIPEVAVKISVNRVGTALRNDIHVATQS